MIFGISMLLISLTLGVGYFTLVKAAKQEGFLKKFGKIVAWFIIVISVIAILCATFNLLILKKGKHHARYRSYKMKSHQCKTLKCPNCDKETDWKKMCQPKEKEGE